MKWRSEMVSNKLKLILALLIGSANAFALPFSDDLVDTQPKSGQLIRPEPSDSIPIGASERYVESQTASLAFTNPNRPTAIGLGRGKRLYEINCAQCHGSWKGGAFVPPAIKPVEWLRQPEVLAPNYLNFPDGFFFTAIHFGFGLNMPSYGNRLSINEHWDIVSYLRSVQKERDDLAKAQMEKK